MPANDSEKRSPQTSLEISHVSENHAQRLREPIVSKSTVVKMDLLAPIDDHRRVFVSWDNVSAFVPGFFIPKNPIIEMTKKVGQFFNRQAEKTPNNGSPPPRQVPLSHCPKEKYAFQILFNITGCVRPGEIGALMGPSGSGKTTLISIVGGRTPKSVTTEGRATFNGNEMNKSIRRSIGYVAQDDLLYTNLTVYETLYYAALLRLPKFMTRAEKIGRVEAVVYALGLEKCRNTLIGGGFVRGISGGERKRVSVGHELLINPSVLILDEPTSGLDSTTAMHLLDTIRSLASGGRTVLTTIHQPASRLFQKLDTVMLLSEGRVLYYGAAHLSTEWFRQQSYPVPYGMNVADFILDIANGDVEGGELDGEQSREHLLKSMTDYLETRPLGFIRTEEEDIKRHSGEMKDFIPFDRFENKNHNSAMFVQKADRWGATFLEQLVILTSRALRNRRFKSLSKQVILQTVGTTIVTILLWWQVGDGNTLLNATDISALLFFVLMYCEFSQLFKAIYTFPTVFRLMVKERTSGMYRLSAFYLSETFCDLPMDYSIPQILIVGAYWACHLRQKTSAFFGFMGLCVLSALGFQTVGLLLGATIPNPESAVAFASVMMIALMITTGFFVRAIPSWLNWVEYINPSYWAYRALMQIEFSDRTYLDCGGIEEEQKPLEECQPIEDLGSSLNLSYDINGRKWPSVLFLLCFLFGSRLVTYYVLRYKTKFSLN